MVQLFSKFLGASLLLASAIAQPGRGCTSRQLTYSEVVDMDDLAAANEVFDLTLGWLEIDPGFGDQTGEGNDINEVVCGSTPFMTRALGGSVPGPTLKVSPGTTMVIKFKNELTYQPESQSSRVVIEMDSTNLEANSHSGMTYVTTTKFDLRRLNKFNDPDVANLHFHGLHVSGILPSDDTTLEVLPGEEYEYVVEIPKDHEPGLHWIHPHHHGSSTLQLVGGAALPIIVKDPEEEEAEESPEHLPQEVRNATERVLVFQDWDLNEAVQSARHANDLLLMESFSQIEGGQSIGQRFVTVNGKYQPVTEIEVGKWERWRILYAGWQDLPLQFGASTGKNTAECEFYLLAKDGIYVSDYPRGPMMYEDGNMLPIPPGGRADFMVRCNKVGETSRFEALGRRNVLVVNAVESNDPNSMEGSLLEEDANQIVSQTQRSSATLSPWSKPDEELPDYLQPVINTAASDGCTCGYEFDGYDDTSRVNGHIYRPGNNFIHTSYLGAVVERSLKGMHEHSYHQHVYPYQLINFPNQEDTNGNEYFKIGDWHDTYLDKNQRGGFVIIRYKTTDIPGKIMVHCHNTLHADRGMIMKEYVRDGNDYDCKCDIFGPIDGMGIIDDIDNPKVIGAIEVEEEEEDIVSGSPSAFLGFGQLVFVLVAAVAGPVLGVGL